MDGIIAQGLEAGGHRGHFLSGDLTLQMGTFALVPQSVREVKVPVIAAGRRDFSSLWSGQNLAGCKKVPAARLTHELAACL